MLIIKNDKLSLPEEFVTCKGKTKPIGEEGKDWWVKTCDKHEWEYSFSDSIYDEGVLKRFNEIKDFDIKHLAILEQYVLDGTEIQSDELKLELLKRENAQLKSVVDMLLIDLLGGM